MSLLFLSLTSTTGCSGAKQRAGPAPSPLLGGIPTDEEVGCTVHAHKEAVGTQSAAVCVCGMLLNLSAAFIGTTLSH